jgi:hypothetical protein
LDRFLISNLNWEISAPLENAPPPPPRLTAQADVKFFQAVSVAVTANVFGQLVDAFDQYTLSLVRQHTPSPRYPPPPRAPCRADRRSPLPSAKMGAKEALLKTKERAEEVLFRVLLSRVDDVLETHDDGEWCPSAPNGGPSPYVVDLVEFLDTTLSLAAITQPLRDNLNLTVCKHIASVLMVRHGSWLQLLFLSHLRMRRRVQNLRAQSSLSNCRRFNIFAVMNLDKDVDALEDFCDTLPTVGLKALFSKIRDVVRLILSDNWDDLFTSAAKQLYPSLESYKLISLLEKSPCTPPPLDMADIERSSRLRRRGPFASRRKELSKTSSAG